MDKRTPIAVYSPANMLQAALLTEMLDDAGIAHRVVNNKIREIAGDPPATKNDPEIWVAAEDGTEAAKVCRAFENRITRRVREINVTTGTVFCYHCGETVGELAEVCPACSGRLE